jgi:serine/threonine-protein kinase RsbW
MTAAPLDGSGTDDDFDGLDLPIVPWPEHEPGRDLELRIPADPALIRVVRLATSGLASMLSFDLDGIEDLKIAVDEACSALIEVSDGSPIHLRLGRINPWGLWVEGTTSTSSDGRTDPERVALSERILDVIVDRHEFVVADGTARFRVLRLADPSASMDSDGVEEGDGVPR